MTSLFQSANTINDIIAGRKHTNAAISLQGLYIRYVQMMPIITPNEESILGPTAFFIYLIRGKE